MSQNFTYALIKSDSGERRVTKREYDALPLRDRVKLILGGGVTFYDAIGNEVPSPQALMRTAKT